MSKRNTTRPNSKKIHEKREEGEGREEGEERWIRRRDKTRRGRERKGEERDKERYLFCFILSGEPARLDDLLWGVGGGGASLIRLETLAQARP